GVEAAHRDAHDPAQRPDRECRTLGGDGPVAHEATASLANLWPAPPASGIRDPTRSVCANLSGLRATPRPRWRSARPGPHKSVGVITAPFFAPGFPDAGRRLGHLAPTTRGHRRPPRPSSARRP